MNWYDATEQAYKNGYEAGFNSGKGEIGICDNCACRSVCMIYDATGGVARCKYRVTKTLSGEWIYAPCEDDETIWVYHCSLCGALSAQKYPYCRECGAKMEMGVEE